MIKRFQTSLPSGSWGQSEPFSHCFIKGHQSFGAFPLLQGWVTRTVLSVSFCVSDLALPTSSAPECSGLLVHQTWMLPQSLFAGDSFCLECLLPSSSLNTSSASWFQFKYHHFTEACPDFPDKIQGSYYLL